MLINVKKYLRLEIIFTFAKISDVDYIISDEEVPEWLLKQREESGVIIL